LNWVLFLLCLSFSVLNQAEISAKLELSSGRIFRGVSQTEDHFAPSISVKYQYAGSAYIGALFSRNDFRNPSNREEKTYFIGFSHRLNPDLHLNFSFVAYDFDPFLETMEPDWQEVHLRINYLRQTSLTLSHANNWLGQDSSSHIELSHLLPITNQLTLQATAGAIFTVNDALPDYGYANLGLIYGLNTRVYLRTDINFTDSSAEIIFNERTDPRLRFSVGYLFQ